LVSPYRVLVTPFLTIPNEVGLVNATRGGSNPLVVDFISSIVDEFGDVPSELILTWPNEIRENKRTVRTSKVKIFLMVRCYSLSIKSCHKMYTLANDLNMITENK
jgi:hypothetical protein